MKTCTCWVGYICLQLGLEAEPYAQIRSLFRWSTCLILWVCLSLPTSTFTLWKHRIIMNETFMNFMNAEARKAAGHSQWLRATRLVYWGDLAAHASWSWEHGAWKRWLVSTCFNRFMVLSFCNKVMQYPQTALRSKCGIDTRNPWDAFWFHICLKWSKMTLGPLSHTFCLSNPQKMHFCICLLV